MIQDLSDTNESIINSKIIFSNIYNVIQIQLFYLKIFYHFVFFLICPSQQFLKEYFLMLSDFVKFSFSVKIFVSSIFFKLELLWFVTSLIKNLEIK